MFVISLDLRVNDICMFYTSIIELLEFMFLRVDDICIFYCRTVRVCVMYWVLHSVSSLFPIFLFSDSVSARWMHVACVGNSYFNFIRPVNYSYKL